MIKEAENSLETHRNKEGPCLSLTSAVFKYILNRAQLPLGRHGLNCVGQLKAQIFFNKYSQPFVTCGFHIQGFNQLRRENSIFTFSTEQFPN